LYVFSGIFFPEFKVDTYFVTALLTILGYSISDTIVVFDRIRENIKNHVKNKKLDEIIELSVTETLARSLFTSLTLVFVLITIFIFGPDSLD
jgi:preprotein translocase subunit SecF